MTISISMRTDEAPASLARATAARSKAPWTNRPRPTICAVFRIPESGDDQLGPLACHPNAEELHALSGDDLGRSACLEDRPQAAEDDPLGTSRDRSRVGGSSGTGPR